MNVWFGNLFITDMRLRQPPVRHVLQNIRLPGTTYTKARILVCALVIQAHSGNETAERMLGAGNLRLESSTSIMFRVQAAESQRISLGLSSASTARRLTLTNRAPRSLHLMCFLDTRSGT